MAGIGLDFDGMFPWRGSIGGIVGFPTMLSRIDIVQMKYKAVDRGKASEQVIVLDATKYKETNLGARQYEIQQYTDEERIITEVGTQTFDIIQYDETQVFLVDEDNIMEI